LNTYGYVNSNPLIAVDPTGQYKVLEWVGRGSYAVARVTVRPAINWSISRALGRSATLGTWVWDVVNEGEDDDVTPFPETMSDAGEQCDDDGGDNCDKIRQLEEQRCFEDYGLWGYDHWIFQGCMSRAAHRWGMCKRNGGSMPGDAPGPWSDADVDGWPTIYD
jgi:hypothetical protein